MKQSLGQMYIDELSPRIQQAFDAELIDSTHPRFRFSAANWYQLWLIPRSKQSPSLVYECDEDINFADNSRCWIFDKDTNEWHEIDGDTCNFGWEDIPNTLRRIVREDFYIFRTIEHSISRSRVLFEMDRPNPQWNVVEVFRFRRWDLCTVRRPTLEEESPRNFGSRQDHLDSNLLEIFLRGLLEVTGAAFSWSIVEGDAITGKIVLIPTNPRSHPLYLLVCDGRVIDMLTGGFTDFSQDPIPGVDAEDLLSTPASKLNSQERGIFYFCVRWIQDGVVEYRQAADESGAIEMMPRIRNSTLGGKEVEVAPNVWRQVSREWDSWW